MMLFITIRFLDILDILMVAFILYQLYSLIKGTVAFNIFIGIFIVYLFWLLVKALNMELIASLMGQFIGVGVLALIIVFQQEIRRFLLYLGSNNQVNKLLGTKNLFASKNISYTDKQVKILVTACKKMASNYTGALIVFTREAKLKDYSRTGEKIDAVISDALLETIFFKNTPLHDGAVIINDNKIVAARCILPITDKQKLNPLLGLRHRAAIGITEATDAVAIVVSEERGEISFVKSGNIKMNVSEMELSDFLRSEVYSLDNFKVEN